MNKNEQKEILTEIGGHKAKVVLDNPANQTKADKLSSMRIALTYIESQNIEVTPEKATEIADKFLEWLKK